jgi:Rieske Fe-S protein
MRRTVKIFLVALSGVILLFTACSKNDADDTSTAVPNVTVSLSVNANSYNTLATVGGVAYISNAGYRGIMLYRASKTSILAFDRTCTYDISDANGIVYALTNGTATCPDCGSVYNLSDGSVNTGPTTIGLKQYTAAFNPNTGALIIIN